MVLDLVMLHTKQASSGKSEHL